MTSHDPLALQAVHLWKQYRRGTLALADVSLDVVHGSITALVGPNAAGKSTLMRTWVGFARPTRGSVRVAGVDPWRDRPGALSHVGYVPQQPALYRGLSVIEHLDLAAHVRAGFDRTAAMHHLAALHIPPRAKPGSLSGGQQAQLMLAIALGTPADILLLDEPLASLDPLARGEFLNLLRRRVRERGSTALLSSHVITDIVAVCDRLIVLGVGHVLLDDSLARAAASHAVAMSPGQAWPGYEAVGSFESESGAIVSVLRWIESAGGPIGAEPSLRPASIDEIVKGYLAAGRQAGNGRAAP